MKYSEFVNEYNSILDSNLNWNTKWIAIDLLREDYHAE